jgi:hypothetical protein
MQCRYHDMHAPDSVASRLRGWPRAGQLCMHLTHSASHEQGPATHNSAHAASPDVDAMAPPSLAQSVATCTWSNQASAPGLLCTQCEQLPTLVTCSNSQILHRRAAWARNGRLVANTRMRAPQVWHLPQRGKCSSISTHDGSFKVVRKAHSAIHGSEQVHGMRVTRTVAKLHRCSAWCSRVSEDNRVNFFLVESMTPDVQPGARLGAISRTQHGQGRVAVNSNVTRTHQHHSCHCTALHCHRQTCSGPLGPLRTCRGSAACMHCIPLQGTPWLQAQL